MTIRHLRVFVCVCRHQSMTKAAEELFVAQPAVSKTITELEKSYGVVLFERINKHIYLTEEGRALFVKAQEVLHAFDEFERKATRSAIAPVLRIGSSLTIGNQQMPNLLRALKECFEEADFLLSINQTSVIESKILDGSLDFAFIQGKPSDANIAARLVSESTLVAACGRKFEIPEALTLKELCRYDLLLREDESASREFLDHIFALENIVVKPVIESVSNQALISAAEENLGVTLLPERLIQRHLKNGSLKRITVTDYDFKRNCYLIFHKNRSFSGVKKEAFAFAEKHFND